MKSLLDSMLEITRTNAHPDELKKEDIDLGAMLTETHELMLPLAEEKNIHFDLHLPPPSEKTVISADKLKLQRCIGNLLENALKFTPEHGKVNISLESNPENFVLTIKDSGSGISPEDQKHIFDRFFRSDVSRHLPGNGLGLALVHAIVTAHKWQISLESELGKGASFIINIPKIVNENKE